MSSGQFKTTEELFEELKVRHKAFETTVLLFEEANKNRVDSLKALQNRLVTVVARELRCQNGVFQTLQSRSLLATSDEPEEESFLETFLHGLIFLVLEEGGEKEAATFLLTKEAIEKLGRPFQELLKHLQTILPFDFSIIEEELFSSIVLSRKIKEPQ